MGLESADLSVEVSALFVSEEGGGLQPVVCRTDDADTLWYSECRLSARRLRAAEAWEAAPSVEHTAAGEVTGDENEETERRTLLRVLGGRLSFFSLRLK